MVKKVLSFVCCLAMCTPIVGMLQDSNVDNSIVVSADTNNYSMKASQKAVDLIKSCEGFSSTAYWDYKQWTIGYGTYVESNTTYPNGITEAQGEQLLYNALVYFEDCVNAFLKRNNITVNQNQFDALVCFTYAIPAWSFKGNEDYTIAQMLINGWENYSDQEVYDTFGLYVKAGSGANKVTLPGLVRRRTMEASLFLYGNTTTEVPLDDGSSRTENQVVSNQVSNQVSQNTVDDSIDITKVKDYTTWIVSDSYGIRLRHSGSLSANVLNVIPNGTILTVTEVAKADGYTWGKVIYKGITGWCALDYCNQIENVDVAFDISNDGKFTLTDIAMMKSYVVSNGTLTDEQLKLVDVDKNGIVDDSDYQKVLNYFILTC